MKVLKKKQLSQGPVVKKFEEKFAKYCGAKYAIAMNNGTATLHSALYALGVQAGDEVITTPFTFVATANAILMQQAKVVFCDIEDTTFNIDATKLEKKITKKTRAIMPVDLFGHIYDVDRINAIGKKHKLPILEDAAQSVAAEYKGQRSGSICDAASFSLYATKNMTAGVGGVVTTDDEDIMEKCKLFRHHGQDEHQVYEYIQFGYNYRMMDMIAAIAVEQLKKINKFTKTRRDNAKRLTEGLQDIPGLILPTERQGYKHVYHQYTVRITPEFGMSRDEFEKKMAAKGIMCKVYYPKPLHVYPHFNQMGYKLGDFPVAEKLAKEVISIPVHPLVTPEDIKFIIKTIKSL